MGVNEAVLEYLVGQNRPYSATDVTQNLLNAHSKGAVQKALEHLAAQGRIIEKENGKQKVYCALQNESGGASKEEAARELQELSASVASATQNLRAVEQQVREAEAELKSLLGAPTTDEAESEVAALELRVQRLRAKLADLTDTCVKVNPEDRKKVDRLHETMLREYRKRKRMCMDVLEQVLENHPKSKKELIEEIGIVTDEEAGYKL
ncbi:homologous-pairing protein 2 homolog isoform X1 [Frankliniella occidentalis]|uniref:Homologous-pairing protein 2 homolog n=1 Tax=Frankliniella occidentalis TaxID=133901 RepID=A0A6J1RYJ5_FRAOC|nr:homologous-pairing protein 2 homolog isoform X1 [Frankliniella occidentalis]